MRSAPSRVDELVAILLPRVRLPEHVRPSMLLDDALVPPDKHAAKVTALRELVRCGGRDDVLVGFHIKSSSDVAAHYRPRLAGDPMESLHVVGLDVRNRVRLEQCVARGGPTSCTVTPTSIMRPIVINACAGLVMLHNHPSGEPSPSPEDIALTERITKACEIVGVRLLDHVIVAAEGSFSFLDAGLLARA